MSGWDTCSHCGSRVAGDAVRCPSCGSPHIVSAEARPEPIVEPPAEAPPEPVEAAPRRRGPAYPKALVVAGVGFVGAASVCCGAALFLSVPRSEYVPDGTPASIEATPSAGAAASAPAPATAGFAAIRARGALRVAADPDAAPFLSRTADGGYEGFEYGVMSAIAAEIGVPLTVVPATFGELAGKLQGGEADLAIGQMSPSGAWAGLGWSTSYLQYSLCLVVPKRSPVKSLAGLHGKRIGMYEDPVVTQFVAANVGAAYERVVFEDYGYFEKLARGKLDAVVYDCPLARHEIGVFADKVRIADDTLNVATYNVAVRSDAGALLADVNAVLRKLGDQGLLARLEARWLGGEAPKQGYRTVTGRVVVVQRGETLASIAARELGSAERAGELHAKNRDVLGDDPDALYAGLRLRVGE